MNKVAIIGVGVMGNGMAVNFLKKGFTVVVWNRTAEKLKDLVDKGAILAGSPKEAAVQADIIFEVTSGDNSSREVWMGKSGILEGVDKSKVLIASATLSADWIDELSEVCRSKDLTLLDIPLTGGRMGAEAGKLILLVGGDEKVLNGIKPDLAAISERIIYFGPVGSGTRFKLILNTVQAIHLTTFAEAMKIAKGAQMNLNSVGDALAERLGATTAMAWQQFGKEVHNFKVELIDKDLRYSKKLAGDLKTPFLDQVLKIFDQEVEDGNGSQDWTIVTKE